MLYLNAVKINGTCSNKTAGKKINKGLNQAETNNIEVKLGYREHNSAQKCRICMIRSNIIL